MPTPTKPTANWPSIIERHVADLKSGEKKAWDKNLEHFNGRAWAATDVGASEAELIKTSTNFVLPLVETAQANLLPPNPRVTLNPRKPADREQIEQGGTIVNYSLQRGKWRKETGMGLFYTVMYGRAPFKTTFDFDTDLPVTRAIDPKNYFFDRTATRFEDMKYEIEATLLSRKQMERKVDEGAYPSWIFETRSGETYPQWLLPGERKPVDGLRDYQTWYLVYEVYDREAGVVFHYLSGERSPILEDALIFRPYDLLTFTFNGVDCGGVSEVSIIRSNQENYNWTDTFELNRHRLSVPVTYYDKKLATADQQHKQLQAPLGARVPVSVPENRSIAESFYQPPLPMSSGLSIDILARQRESMAYVSALSDSQRGQTIGAKTATEMEWIKQQIRDRLGPRLALVDELTESIASKHFFLAQRFMREEKVVQLIGEKEWRTVNPFTLEGVDATFDIVAYNPMKMNAAVRLEALRNLQPILVNNPYVKQRKLAEILLRDVQAGEVEDLLLTDEELAAQQAPPAGAPPGAPLPPPGAPTPSPATPLDPAPPPIDPGSMPPGGPIA